MQKEISNDRPDYFVSFSPTSQTPARDSSDIICDKRSIKVSLGDASIKTSLLTF